METVYNTFIVDTQYMLQFIDGAMFNKLIRKSHTYNRWFILMIAR